MISTQVANNSFRAYLGNEELLQQRQNTHARNQKEKSRKVVTESSHSRYFTDGVRAPLLSDISFGQSCRLDVVRPVKQQLTGSPTPDSPGRKTVIQHIPFEKEDSNVCNSDKASHSIKSMKFLLPNGSLRSTDEPSISSRSVSDLELRWKRPNSKTADARDVLYRNTYCENNKKLRYHVTSLPSIATQNGAVPRINKPKLTNKKKIAHKQVEISKNKDSGALESKPLEVKKLNTPPEVGFLKVQKIKSNADQTSSKTDDLFLTVKQPTDLYRQNTGYPLELRTERPLKYETVSPFGFRTFRKHSLLQNILPYSNRDYKSADAYKEYLEAVKSKMEISNDSKTKFDQDVKNCPFGRENRMLQSVIDVNKPKNRNGIISHDSKSLVIEIKPTWNEVSNGINDDADSDIDININSYCPTNTPAQE